MNVIFLLSVLVDMASDTQAPGGELPGDPDAAVRVLVETFYRGGTMATVARELGIPHGTARSRLHYALDALRQHLDEHDAIAC
jgi:Sigma-70, region 4